MIELDGPEQLAARLVRAGHSEKQAMEAAWAALSLQRYGAGLFVTKQTEPALIAAAKLLLLPVARLPATRPNGRLRPGLRRG